MDNQLEKILEMKNFVIYRTNCSCTSSNHAIDLEIEYIPELDQYSIIFSTILTSEYSILNNPFKNLFERIKRSLSILFKGQIEVSSEFIFRDSKHIEEFTKVLLNPSTKNIQN